MDTGITAIKEISAFNIASTDSLEDLVYRLRGNLNKTRDIKKHRLGVFTAMRKVLDYWSDKAEAVSVFALALAVLAAIVVLVSALAALATLATLAALGALGVLFAAAVFPRDKEKETSIIISFISLCLSFISLYLSLGWPGSLGLSLLFSFSIGHAIILMIQDRLPSKNQGKYGLKQEILAPEQIKSEIAQYVKGIINKYKEEITGPDSSYGAHLQKLKAKKEQARSAFNYWQARMNSESDQTEYVGKRLQIAERLSKGADKELTDFNNEETDILNRLDGLERIVPTLETEIMDHYQDRVLETLETDLVYLHEESGTIVRSTLEHFFYDMSELEQAIRALRLKALPQLENGILSELEERVNDICEPMLVAKTSN